mmetsp:Transcript_68635/g.146992  ORF Transcript_68635/g.146992 Transcript_68635/m.146992 type:complete len:374 (+) Transcript_68635:445-1566(+)
MPLRIAHCCDELRAQGAFLGLRLLRCLLALTLSLPRMAAATLAATACVAATALAGTPPLQAERPQHPRPPRGSDFSRRWCRGGSNGFGHMCGEQWGELRGRRPRRLRDPVPKCSTLLLLLLLLLFVLLWRRRQRGSGRRGTRQRRLGQSGVNEDLRGLTTRPRAAATARSNGGSASPQCNRFEDLALQVWPQGEGLEDASHALIGVEATLQNMGCPVAALPPPQCRHELRSASLHEARSEPRAHPAARTEATAEAPVSNTGILWMVPDAPLACAVGRRRWPSARASGAGSCDVSQLVPSPRGHLGPPGLGLKSPLRLEVLSAYSADETAALPATSRRRARLLRPEDIHATTPSGSRWRHGDKGGRGGNGRKSP